MFKNNLLIIHYFMIEQNKNIGGFMLTKKQNELLTYLIKCIESDGVTPSYEEICSVLYF